MNHRDTETQRKTRTNLLGRSLFWLIFGLSLWLCVSVVGLGRHAFSQTASIKSKPAKIAIQEVLDNQVTAWNKGDLKEFMAGYWHSPDLSFFSGKDKQRGWEATYERYRKRYQTDGGEMGKLSFSELQIEI